MLKLYQRDGKYYWHTVSNGRYERHGPFIHRNEALYHMGNHAPIDYLVLSNMQLRGLA